MNTSHRPFLVLALACFLVGGVAHADYVAYSVGKKDKSPLPESLDGVDTKYLVNLEWGDYAGRKARVGVLEVDNTSSSSSFTVSSAAGDIDYSSSQNGVPVNGIEAIVIDAMSRSNRFRLVERTVLSDVLGEQDLTRTGRVAKPSGAATGNVLGAEYLVQVVITDYESNTSGSKGGLGGLLRNKVPIVGGVKLGKGEGRVGLNFRLIDAETSEIVYTRQIESQIKETNLALGGIGWGSDVALGGFFSKYARTPIGQAVIAGVNEGVFDLIKQVGAQSAQGSVVKADASQIFTNLGSGSVAVGDILEVREMGEELIDPETGISLGGSETVLGTVAIVQVQDKFSIAKPVNLSKTPERGTKLVSTKPAATLEFADSFEKPK